MIVEKWNRDGGTVVQSCETVEHVMVEQLNRYGGTVEHLNVER